MRSVVFDEDDDEDDGKDDSEGEDCEDALYLFAKLAASKDS